jgi:hypothetical protein
VAFVLGRERARCGMVVALLGGEIVTRALCVEDSGRQCEQLDRVGGFSLKEDRVRVGWRIGFD